jgi:hypothetical protein
MLPSEAFVWFLTVASLSVIVRLSTSSKILILDAVLYCVVFCLGPLMFYVGK